MRNYFSKLSSKLIIAFSLLLALCFFTSNGYAEKRELSDQLNAKTTQVAHYYYYYHPYRHYRYYRYYDYGPPRYYYRHHYYRYY